MKKFIPVLLVFGVFAFINPTVAEAASCNNLTFSTAPSSVTLGAVTTVFTVNASDQSFTISDCSLTSGTGQVVTLDDGASNGTFYSDAAGTLPITTVTLSNGTSDTSHSASFYYKDTVLGSRTITALVTFDSSDPNQNLSVVPVMDGAGTMTVSPNSVLTGSTGNNFTFTFTNNSGANFDNNSILTFTVPAGFPNPQKTTVGSAGYVTVANTSCSNNPSNGTGDITVSGSVATINIEDCSNNDTFQLQYNNITAPVANTYTFTTATRDGSSGTLNIASSPVVTVTPPADPTLFSKGLVSISFDDGSKSIFNNIGSLNGLKSTQYIITGSMKCADGGVGCADFMTTANVASLKTAGHEIAVHTRTDQCAPTEGCPGIGSRDLPTDQMMAEVDGARSDLLNSVGIGVPASTLAYPFGEFDDDLIAKLKSAGIVGARTVFPDELNTKATDRYKLYSKQVNADTTLATVQGWIDEAISSKKWLILVFHKVDAGCVNPTGLLGDTYCTTPTILSDISNYILSKSATLDSLTVAQGLALMNNAPVSNSGVPVVNQANITAEATSPAGALVTFNPSVSDDDTGLASPLSPFCTVLPQVSHPIWGVNFLTVATSTRLFGMGTTTVTCTAADTGGRIGTKIFDVGVINSAAPTLTLVASSSNPTNISPIVFNVVFSEPVTGFVLSDLSGSIVNGSAVNLTGSGTNYTFEVSPSVDGLVTVSVPANSAQDAGGLGNLVTSSVSVTYDHTAPTLEVTSGPAEGTTITTDSATFEFMSSGANTLECKLDGGVFEACTSPKVLTGLAQGAHIFTVKATDIALNSIEVIRNFTVDSVAPTLAQVVAVPNPANSLPSYTFSSTEAGAITYSGDCSSTAVSATVGNNTIAFNTLSGGIHNNCSIVVTDAFGNASTALMVNEFTVDDSTPVITVSTAPSAYINTTDTNIDFSVDDVSALVTCTLDNVVTACAPGTTVALSALTESAHVFEIVAKDEVSNTATTTINFTVDVTAPVVTVTTLLTTNDTTPTLTGTTDDVADVKVGLNGKEYTTTPVAGNWSVTVPAEDTLLDGTYTVTASSTDLAGNASFVAEGTVVINTEAPNLTVATPGSNSTFITGTTDTDVTSVNVVVDGIGYLATTTAEGLWSAEVTAVLGEAVYEVSVTATDPLGNTATVAVNLIVDHTAPIVTPTGANPQDVAFQGTYTELGATATDNIDATVTVVISGSVDTSVNGAEYTITYTATDVSGNVGSASRTVKIKDQSAPVIALNGASPMNVALGTVYTEPGATATDNVDPSVTVVVGGDTVDTSIIGTYEVTYNAMDAEGNTSVEVVRTVVVSDLVVSAEQNSTVTTNSITISWTTSHPATSRVVWDGVSHNPVVEPGPNYGYANSTDEDSTMVTEHSVTVTGLTPGGTYYFRPVSHGSPEVVGTEISAQTSVPPPVSGGGGGGGFSSSRKIPPLATNIPATGEVLGASTGGSFKFTLTTSIGSTGNEVTELQKRLTLEGLYTGPITGYFGVLTQSAVKAYQSKYGIDPVGIVGPKTRAQLNGTSAPVSANTGNVLGASTVAPDLSKMTIEEMKALLDKLQAELAALTNKLGMSK